jgi:hypothetical protein
MDIWDSTWMNSTEGGNLGDSDKSKWHRYGNGQTQLPCQASEALSGRQLHPTGLVMILPPSESFSRGIRRAHQNGRGASTLLVPTLWQTWPSCCSMFYALQSSLHECFYWQPSTSAWSHEHRFSLWQYLYDNLPAIIWQAAPMLSLTLLHIKVIEKSELGIILLLPFIVLVL